MISSAHKCGCQTHPEPHNQHSSKSIDKADCENSNECETCSNDEKVKPQLVSEIANKGLPYKEIEAIINNNHMVLRMQNEEPQPEFEPSCDCLQQNIEQSSTINNEQKNDVVFQKAGQGTKTMFLYPQPDQKNQESKSEKMDDVKRISVGENLPTENPEENPNIFILKIKKKSESGDKRYNLDLEFHAPRPWSKQKQ